MKHLAFLIAVCATGFISTSAMAQTYVGISGGRTYDPDNCDRSVLKSCDKTAFGLKVYGGYKFTPNIAMEGAYTHLGKFDASFFPRKMAGGLPDLNLNVSRKVFSLSLGGAFFYEMNPGLTAVGRLGLASVKTKIDLSLPIPIPFDLSWRKTSPYLGVGLGFSLTPSLSLNGMVDLNRIDGENAYMFGAGVSYGF